MAKIVTLKKNDEYVYPVTTGEAVIGAVYTEEPGEDAPAQPWITEDMIDAVIKKKYAYAPGDVLYIGSQLLIGNVSSNAGAVDWFLPLNKDLSGVTSCTVTLEGAVNGYYFFSENQSAYPGWGRQHPGTYDASLRLNGVRFTTTMESGTGNGRVYQYSTALGSFGNLTVRFS